VTRTSAASARIVAVPTLPVEEIFYPWARDLSDEIAEVIEEGVQEHHVVKMLLDEVRQLLPGDDEWVAKLTVVVENVEHHEEEEESEMFPQIRSASDADALAALADRLEARKAELGAPVLADKQDMTTEQLRELAKEQEIPGRSSMAHLSSHLLGHGSCVQRVSGRDHQSALEVGHEGIHARALRRLGAAGLRRADPMSGRKR
jgi:hypothetical protein